MKWQFSKYLFMEAEQRQKKQSLRWVLLGGFFITFIKLAAWIYTGSNAILSDAIESMINMAAGCFALLSLFYSSRPRNNYYPYGRGKMEFLGAAVEGSMIFLAGAVVISKAVYNLFEPRPISGMGLGIVVICFSIVANFALGKFLLNKAARYNSIVLRSDSRRILSDALSSLATVAALAIIYFKSILWVDSALAIVSGALIVRTGVKLIRQSLTGLLDAADTTTLEGVLNILQDHSKPGWIEIKNLRSSHYGMYLYVDCRLTMPWYWNLEQISGELRAAEELINEHFKERVELFVQAEACQPKHCSKCRVQDCTFRQHSYKKQERLVLKDVLEPGKFEKPSLRTAA